LALVATVVAAAALSACGSSANTADNQKAAPISVTQAKRIVSDASKGLVNAPGTGYVKPDDLKPVTKFTGPYPIKRDKTMSKKNVYLIGCLPFAGCLRTVRMGQEVFKKFGWDTHTLYGDATPATEQKMMNTAITSGADVIYTVAVTDSHVGQQLALAKKKGIPVVAMGGGPGFDADVDGRENIEKELVGAKIISETGGKANAVFLDLQGQPALGVSAGVTMLKGCAGCSVKKETWTTTEIINPVTAPQKFKAIVAADPGLKYFVYPTAGMPMQSVLPAGKGKLTFALSDLDPSTLALLDQIPYQTATPQSWMAYAGVDAVLRLLSHKTVPKPGHWGIGSTLVTQVHKPKDSTPAAIAAFEKAQLDYTTPYEKAWGVDLTNVN
jgi:ABC-type sugar transport system substrate-binding protein